MQLTCPECKNEVDLSGYPSVENDAVVECNSCGITLQVNNIDGDSIVAEVIDEGK